MGVDIRDDLLPALLADPVQAGKRCARHVHRVTRERLGVEGFVRHEGVDGSQPILSGSAEQESAAFPAPRTGRFQVLRQFMPQRQRDAQLGRR